MHTNSGNTHGTLSMTKQWSQKCMSDAIPAQTDRQLLKWTDQVEPEASSSLQITQGPECSCHCGNNQQPKLSCFQSSIGLARVSTGRAFLFIAS